MGNVVIFNSFFNIIYFDVFIKMFLFTSFFYLNLRKGYISIIITGQILIFTAEIRNLNSFVTIKPFRIYLKIPSLQIVPNMIQGNKSHVADRHISLNAFSYKNYNKCTHLLKSRYFRFW